MNKKGFIDLDDVNPIAILLAVAGALIAFYISGKADTTFLWRILAAVGTFIMSFLIVNAMSS